MSWVPFDGVGRVLRRDGGGVVRRVVKEASGVGMLAVPQRNDEDLLWFSGHVSLDGTQLQVLGIAEATGNTCCEPAYRVSLCGGGCCAVARCHRSGGNALCLDPLDACGLSFDAMRVFSGPPAATLVEHFFPNLHRRLGEDDVVVVSGTLRVAQLVFTTSGDDYAPARTFQ